MARKETEDWLRSSLRELTGKSWDLSYTSRDGKSQSEVIFASCEGMEIAFCDGEPQSHDLLRKKIGDCSHDMCHQDWVHRISTDDMRRMAHAAVRSESHPQEFRSVMADLRDRYSFIPAEPNSEVKPDERED